MPTSPLSKQEIYARVAHEFSINRDELDSFLYADLPSEKCLAAAQKEFSPVEIALRTNLALVQGLLARARFVEIVMDGNSAAVVRQAKRKGLICVVGKDEGSNQTRLSLSGPYSLFRSTLLYGRAPGEIVPVLAWCNQYELAAQIVIEEKSLELRIKSGDPVFPSEPPKPFDSKLEERFARQFHRVTKTWDIIREPEPVRAAGTLIFPDFALQHRHDPSRRWLLEIVGYWTPDYLRKKLEGMREAKIANLLLCINSTLNCADEALPEGASIIRFSKRLGPEAVLDIIGRE